MANNPLFAAHHNIRIECEADALQALGVPGPGLIFQLSDLAPQFFDLASGLAGAVFQKFMNYNVRAAFVLPVDHQFGPRVSELAREHAQHPNLRIVTTDAEAVAWLESL